MKVFLQVLTAAGVVIDIVKKLIPKKHKKKPNEGEEKKVD